MVTEEETATSVCGVWHLTGGSNHNAKIKLSAVGGGGGGAGAAEISTGGGGGEKHYNVALCCCQLAVIAAI